MHLLGNTTKSLLAALTIGTCVAALTGCSAKPIEEKGSNSSKLLAPKAIYKALASDQTKQMLGIAEWRVYRGKTSFILTGYDSTGQAVKGVAVAFDGQTSSMKPSIRARLLDGSRFGARHEYGGGSKADALLASTSKEFVARAINDMKSLKQQLLTGPSKHHLGSACSADMVAVMASALSCLTAAGIDTKTPNKAAVLQCILAAVSASSASSSCQDTGTTGSTGSPSTPSPSTGGKSGDADKSGEQDKSGEKDGDKAKDDEKDKDGDDKDADKAKDKADDEKDDQKDTDEKQDQEQDSEDAKNDTEAGNDAQSTSEDQDCSSCSGTGADDLQTDDNTGDVETADSGDTGGGDEGGDTG